MRNVTKQKINKTTQANKLMNVNYDDNSQSIMETALDIAPKDMVSLVARRDQELKVGCCMLRVSGLPPSATLLGIIGQRVSSLILL